jgi:hypothetical protein
MAEVVTIVPNKDNTLYEDIQGSISNGAGSSLLVGRGESDTSIRRALVAFDLSGHVPPGSRINSANLTLHLSGTLSGPQSVQLHKVLSDWGEGISVGQPEGDLGADATSSDATWLHTFYQHSFWQKAGGDFVAEPTATTEVNDIGFHTWGNTQEMVEDVQNWVDNPASNAG